MLKIAVASSLLKSQKRVVLIRILKLFDFSFSLWPIWDKFPTESRLKTTIMWNYYSVNDDSTTGNVISRTLL